MGERLQWCGPLNRNDAFVSIYLQLSEPGLASCRSGDGTPRVAGGHMRASLDAMVSGQIAADT